MRVLFGLTTALTLALMGAPRAEDFAFFNLIKDGKVSKDEVAKHCGAPDGMVRAFSVASLNLTLAEFHERVRYTDRQFTNANASPGEWDGEVYKTICPGLYTFSVDYITAAKDGATDGDVTVHIHVWHKAKGGARPGELAAVAEKTGSSARGTGHATATLALGTGDEISTHSLSADGKPRHFERIQLNAVRVHHMPELAADFDLAAWEADRVESDKVRTAPMGGN
ncbi:MAG: hypothetical protein SFV19_16640 [Rhodospirillaceae bacterium]|nr:hypothetical protein [Rhodospirillaceae bacterium]